MSLILYAQLLFGNLFVIRTLQIFRGRALLSKNTVTKIGTLFICAEITANFFCAHSFFASFVVNSIGLALTLAILFFCERRQIAALRAEIPLFFDRWILNLRLGSALTTARDTALRDHSEAFQSLAQPLFTTRYAHPETRRHLLFERKLQRELESIHREAHSALARLENLRSLLRKTTEFRRKSGQAQQQTRIQSTVMVILLFALTLFTVHRYGWRQSSDLIVASQLLSALGILIMCLIAKKSKWKI